MTPRLRRLTADAKQMNSRLAAHPSISIVEQWGDPPERYALLFKLPSLIGEKGGKMQVGKQHSAEIFLGPDYPRRPPFCRMTSAVFHPNIDPQKICIGDHWSAGQSLVELVCRIGEMLCLQSYNVQSPLNAEAAAWVDQHQDKLPLLAKDLSAGA